MLTHWCPWDSILSHSITTHITIPNNGRWSTQCVKWGHWARICEHVADLHTFFQSQRICCIRNVNEKEIDRKYLCMKARKEDGVLRVESVLELNCCGWLLSVFCPCVYCTRAPPLWSFDVVDVVEKMLFLKRVASYYMLNTAPFDEWALRQM